MMLQLLSPEWLEQITPGSQRKSSGASDAKGQSIKGKDPVGCNYIVLFFLPVFGEFYNSLIVLGNRLKNLV